MSDDEKILITGGSGFIGRSFLRILAHNRKKAFVFTRSIKTLKLPEINRGLIEPFEIDLCDQVKVEKWLTTHRPDKIVHLAGATQHKDASGQTCNELNWKATKGFFEVLARIDVKKVITIGTADEYGNQNTPQNEQMPLQPQTAYAESKARANEFALELHRTCKFQAVILRIFTAYGAGQPPQMFLSQLIRSALGGKEFNMTDGRQKRDYIYVDDAARAIYAALLEENIAGKSFNVGTGQAYSLRDVAEKTWKMCGAERKLLKIGARPKPLGESFDTQADISAAIRELGWTPQTSLDEGLRLTVEQAKLSES